MRLVTLHLNVGKRKDNLSQLLWSSIRAKIRGKHGWNACIAEVTAWRHCSLRSTASTDHSLSPTVSFTAPHYSFTLCMLLLTAAVKSGRIHDELQFFACGQRFSKKEKNSLICRDRRSRSDCSVHLMVDNTSVN